MRALEGVFRARVARRVVWLFVLSAVVPVVVMGAISFRAVNGQLEAHSRERLAQLAKNAGQSVLQQLLLADGALRTVREAARRGEVGALRPSTLPSLVRGAAVVRGESAVEHVFGPPFEPRPLDPAEAARLERDELVLRVSADGRRALRVALHVDPADPERGAIWLELSGDSVWSAAETFVTLPTVVDFCVLSGPRSPLHCTSGSARLPEAFAGFGSAATSTTFSVDDALGSLIVGAWSFYPQRNFEQPPWSVLVAETSEAVYAPLSGFSTTFGLSLLFAVLLVVLLSNVQIRRTLEPLQALEAGTERIARGDLESRVEVRTDDEFGSLATSFNAMAGRLDVQFRQFEAIQAVGQAALDGFERDEVVLAALLELPSVSACRSAAILLAPPDRSAPSEIVWRIGERGLGGTKLSLSDEELGWLREHPDHEGEPEPPLPFFGAARRGLGGGALFAFPHLVKGRVHGATLVEMARGTAALDEETARRLRQVASQVAVALEDVRLVSELEDMSWGALVALARAIDAKSEWTAGHSERVTGMAMALGRQMGLGPEELDTLHRGGLLHDVGKIGVPNALLNKHGGLSEAEAALLRAHPTIGARILAPIKAFAPAIPLVLQHHERWDGSGYPHGLSGEQIHPLTRILSVADAFDAMASPRPYRPGRAEQAVLEDIVRESGVHFDPAVVGALVDLMRERGTFYPGEVGRISA